MPDNISTKDASEAVQVIKTTETASVHTPHVNVDTLPSNLAKEAKQDNIITLLTDLLAEFRDDVFVSATIWEDRSSVVSVFYREERVRSQDDGSISTVYTRLSDNTVVGSLPAGAVPVQGSADRTTESFRYRATANGTGYSTNDWLTNVIIYDKDGAGTVLSSSWYNLTTGSNISAPTGTDIQAEGDNQLTDSQLRATPVSVSLPNGTHVVGPTGQSVINTDLLTGNVNGWYDAAAFQSGSIQIIATAGISAGAIFFEQTNNNASTTGLQLIVSEVISINTNPQNTAITIAANANRMFRFGINARYIRVRISTAFVGGTVQAISFFSEFPFSSPSMYVQQAAAANFAVTLASTTLTAGTAAVGDFGMQYRGSATGAALIYKINSAASTNAGVVKAGAGRLVGYQIQNTTGAILYVKLHNTTTAPTVGSTAVHYVIPVPANGKAELDIPGGIGFTTGMSISMVTGSSDTDATAVTAGALIGALHYA